MIIIGLAGEARVGKDTAADFLIQEHWFEPISFATPIKRGVQSAFGLDPDKPNENREAILSDYGFSKRQLYQMFGTEFGRDMLGDDIWIKVAQRTLNNIIYQEENNPGLFTDSKGIVFTDVRFDNEAEFIKRNGGHIIKIERTVNMPRVNPHCSEDGINPNLITTTIVNNGTIKELHDQINLVLQEIKKCKVSSAA
jgi:hypothetical protein